MTESTPEFRRRRHHHSRSPRRKMYRLNVHEDDSPTRDDLPSKHYRRRRRKRRSATLSPCPMRPRQSKGDPRRNSDVDHATEYFLHPLSPAALNIEVGGLSPVSPGPSSAFSGVQKRPELPLFARRGKLRKTSSMPTDVSLDELDEQQSKVNKIQDILNSLNFSKFHVSERKNSPDGSYSGDAWATPSEADSPSESDVIATDIEELKVAAQSIEALSRKTLYPPSGLQKSGSGSRNIPTLSVSSVPDVPSSIASSSEAQRRSGITTRLGGHPRGVMQFLPSVKTSDFLSKTAYESYLATKSRREKLGNDGTNGGAFVQYHQQAPITATSSYNNFFQEHPDLQMRRKYSVPDCFYNYELVRPSSQNFLLVPSDPISQSAESAEEAYDFEAMYSDALPTLVSSSSQTRRSSLSQDHRFHRVSRFASFAAPATGNSQRAASKAVTRQYSAREKPIVDLDGTFPDRIKGAESLAGFRRFGRLLQSLRTSRQNSPDADMALSPASSESPLSSPGTGIRHHLHAVGPNPSWQRSGGLLGATPSDSELSADLMLWRKRSRDSIRKHEGSRSRSCNFEDTRTHIVRELYDTEDNYVHNLRLMVKKYVRPLKRPELCPLIESSLVDEIFFQIPEILGHHELFHAALKSRLDNWDSRQKIGDIILNNFTKQCVIDTYTAFINNWKNAKQAIRTACSTKNAFAKYLERCAREHHNKLTLDALLIMPVQRIPRYELLIKELLKHTSVEHPDHSLLLRAQKEIHELATKINHVEQEQGLSEQMQQRLRELEAIVDGLDDLVLHDRVFHRYDLVCVQSQGGKKERCIFLLSDLVLITSVKRKSTAGLKKTSAASHELLENHKFKLLMKISLDDLEVAKNTLPLYTKLQTEVSQIQEDLRVLNKTTELTALLKFDHEDIDKEVDAYREKVRCELTTKQQEMSNDPVLTSMDLLVTTEEGIETMLVTFHNADHRAAWQKCFDEAKQSLECLKSKKPPPLFIKPLPIQKTRAGLHFTCASQTAGKNENGYPNVWVCSSDGYVGQMATVNLTPEPDMESCNGISNSKILCVCPVPVAKIPWQDFLMLGSAQKRKHLTPSFHPLPVPRPNTTETSIPTTKLELDSESSDNDDSTTAETSKSSSGGTAWKEEEIFQTDHIEDDEQVSTMWLGTDDGGILVYNFNDSIRTRKNRLRAQHNTAVTAMIYIDDRVFASLASGEIVAYERSAEEGWNWDLEKHRKFKLDVELQGPISSMLSVTSRLWLSCGNRIHVLNQHKWQHENWFHVNSDDESSVSRMSSSGLGVWLSMQGSPVIKLHHSLSFECLLEVNVSPIVTKTLAGCDDIIRQHKLACLRVTDLMCCKDLLWIGTSAGIILHLPLPHLSHNSTRLVTSPILSVSPLGHCGQCRFLLSVDLHGSMSRSGSFSLQNNSDYNRRRMSLNVAALQQGKIYVISGGDGFEDFQDLSTDEGDDSTGREDSTNHLLFWQV